MGVSGQLHAPAALLPPEKRPPVPIVQEAGWAPELVWTQRIEEKSVAPTGDRTPVVQPVVRHYTMFSKVISSIHVFFLKLCIHFSSHRVLYDLITPIFHSI
jgi:hypothetical protein